MAGAGVRRISAGGALARAAWAGFMGAATEIARDGTFTGLAGAASSADIEAAFAAGDQGSTDQRRSLPHADGRLRPPLP
jgi:2-methylisocitrate lyase-like PEP mutase family enzyme